MEVDSAVPLEVDSYDDLARWIVSSSQNQHGILYYLKKSDKFILASLVSFSGYYNFTGLPILLFTYIDKEPDGSFLRYDVRADAKNRIGYTSGFNENDSNLGYIQYIPIIKLKKIPAIFNSLT
jgi:hypothetical protein